MSDDQTPQIPTDVPTETQTPVVENPDSSNPSIPPNPPDVPTVETPTPEPEPVVAPEPTLVVDIPIPNFRFPFNGDFPVTFAFNTQATTDEMKAKFQQWEISGHHGIDFGLPEGTEVLAIDSGKVLQSSENGDYGISVTIQHPWGQSLYAHLKETKVSEGQEVNSGDLIGISGQTGAAFGAHLHFGIKPNNPNETNGYLGFIDPTQYLPSISQIPQVPQNPQPEPENPKEEVPAPEIKVEEPKPVEVPIPDVSINIEPVIPLAQPQNPLPSPETVVSDEQVQKQVDEKFKVELEARRLKANEARKENRQEHLAAIEKLLQDKKEITNQNVRDLTHVSQTTATEYLSTLVKSGRIKVEGKAKATVYKNIFS